MTTYVALLRAVNVGGKGKMPMADLRSLAEAAGLSEVRTYIQSGNLVFSSVKTPSAVKSVLEEELGGYAKKPVGVVIRTSQEMQAVLEANPFPDAEPSKVGVLFLDKPLSPNEIDTAKGRENEEIELGDRELFIHYPSGMGRTKLRLSAMSEGTARNINTVGKLVKMTTDA